MRKHLKSAIILATSLAAIVGFYSLLSPRYGANVDITELLLKEGSAMFLAPPKYSRVCVLPFQDSLSFWRDRHYRTYKSNIEIDPISPDIDVFWAIVLVDDKAKYLDVKLIRQNRLSSGGAGGCSLQITLTVQNGTAGPEATFVRN